MRLNGFRKILTSSSQYRLMKSTTLSDRAGASKMNLVNNLEKASTNKHSENLHGLKQGALSSGDL